MANSGRPQLPSAVYVRVCNTRVCVSAGCMHVQECLHKCLSACVWKKLKFSGLAIMSSCAKQGRWRGWQACSLLSHTHKEMPMLLYACTPPHWLWFVYMVFSRPLTSPSLVPPLSPSSLLLSVSLTAFNLSSCSRLLPSVSLLPSLRNHDSPFLSSLLAPIQNPSFSLLSSSSIFVLRSPFSYFNPVILSSVRCIVAPMCEMHFKNALCWTSLLISLPN